MRWALAVIFGLVAASPALADPKPLTDITQAEWLHRPSVQDMMAFWPAGARNQNGRVVMQCIVAAQGTLDGCVVRSETPPGLGFGAAAVAMSKLFLMRPPMRDGVPIEGAEVSIPINFRGEGGSPNPPVGTIPVMHDAPWIAAPTADQLAQAFPGQARGVAPAGHVVLRCTVRSDGALINCDSVEETPTGKGFAAAARSLSREFRLVVDPSAMRYGSLDVDVPFDFRDPSQSARPPPEIYAPRWVRAGDPEQVAALFPQAAITAGDAHGSASVDCVVAHDGSLTACAIASEDPAGVGFGDAALRTAALMRMSVWTVQGVPVDGARITLPIRFDRPAVTPAATTPPKP